MTSESRERFAVLVERQLAGLLAPAESAELSALLEASSEARQLYLRAVEFHLDLEIRGEKKSTTRITAVSRPVAGGRLRRFDIVAIAAGFLLVAGLFAYWSAARPGSPHSPGVSDSSKGVAVAGRPEVPPSPAIPPPPLPALYSAAEIQELRRGVVANVWLTNMTVLVSECMRYRNLTNEWAQFQADIANYDSKIKYNLAELSRAGEKMSLEAHLAQGDQVLGLGQRDFTTMKAGEAALHLHTWLKTWRSGAGLEQVNVRRGDKRMTLYVGFPEETKELLSLLRHPALELEGNPGDATGVALAIPGEVLKDITGRFETLPAGYRSYLVPAEGKRLDHLLLAKKGTQEDIDWLRARIVGEALPSFQREADSVRSKVLELEPKLKENVASDVIYRKNGTKFEGQIIAQTPEKVKIKGIYGAVEIPREDILKIEKGKGAATEFPAKYAEAKGSLEKLVPLLAWCTEKNIKREREFVAYVILTMDASNEKARTAVGLGRPTISGPPIRPEK